MIRFDDVRFAIGTRPILNGISLTVEEGQTLALLGRSGSGKTTALRMVNAMRFPTRGSVVVDGYETRSWNPVQLRRRIGYVIQEVGLFPHRTVHENIATVPRLLGWRPQRIRQRVADLMSELGLDPAAFQHRYPSELSGGQRQRVGVARALAAEPRILLFDEPFGALDPITRREMQDLFLIIRERHRVTSVFVTHDLEEALRLGTRIGLLVEGRLEVVASPSDFRASANPEARRFLATLTNTAEKGLS